MTPEAPAQQGLVIFLTGTPVTNGTAADLISPLSILDRLHTVARAPRHSAVKAFKRQFMRYEVTTDSKGRERGKYTGIKNAEVMQDRMRTSCYIRREKAQVLTDLPPLLRAEVPLSLNGALDAYRKAEDDMERWIAENGGVEAVKRYRRAEAIVRLGKLMTLAGEAKVGAALEWIDQYREQRPGKSLVVFAKHLSVQTMLVEALRATGEGVVHFGGGLTPEQVSERTDAFQSGAARFAVCSIAAAGVGITLTAADTVLMVQQDWTPKDADQAEARIHRPGQESGRVEAVYLLATGTVDDDLFALVEEKREVFRAACVGEAREEDLVSLSEEGMQDAVLSRHFG